MLFGKPKTRKMKFSVYSITGGSITAGCAIYDTMQSSSRKWLRPLRWGQAHQSPPCSAGGFSEERACCLTKCPPIYSPAWKSCFRLPGLLPFALHSRAILRFALIFIKPTSLSKHSGQHVEASTIMLARFTSCSPEQAKEYGISDEYIYSTGKEIRRCRR